MQIQDAQIPAGAFEDIETEALLCYREVEA